MEGFFNAEHHDKAIAALQHDSILYKTWNHNVRDPRSFPGRIAAMQVRHKSQQGLRLESLYSRFQGDIFSFCPPRS